MVVGCERKQRGAGSEVGWKDLEASRTASHYEAADTRSGREPTQGPELCKHSIFNSVIKTFRNDLSTPRWSSSVPNFDFRHYSEDVQLPAQTDRPNAPHRPKQGPVLSVITVDDGFDVDHIAVEGLSVAHERMGMLKITLSALSTSSPSPKTVMLKDVRQGGDLSSGMDNIAFDNDAVATIPISLTSSAASLTGPFAPAADLNMLAVGGGMDAGMGGSKGSWVLRIVDLGSAHDSRTIDLQEWSLLLCPTVSAATTDMPAMTDMQDSESGSSDVSTGGMPITSDMSSLAQSADEGIVNETMLLDNLLERL
eukprot:gene29968-18034_t